jgi:methylenetetrahydrofolate reductase (NADPH)
MTRPDVSFEFFPPRSAPASSQLWTTITALEPLEPHFVSVTYGAGGTTREQTVATVLRIHTTTRLNAAAHLTCVAASRHEIDQLLQTYWEAGIRRIVALRGDPPGGGAYAPHPEGYRDAAALVAGIRAIGDFEISVAAYPETHPAALDAESDLDNLKRKLDAGANRAITQYFFDTTVYLRFVERARKAGIAAPIVPGIMPVTNFVQLVRFSKMCGTAVPAWLAELFEGLDEDPDTRKLVAAMVATEQCRALAAAGVESFHFYTLNRADLILGICRRLGLKPAAAGLKPGLATDQPPPARDPTVP